MVLANPSYAKQTLDSFCLSQIIGRALCFQKARPRPQELGGRDKGRRGRAYRETDAECTDLEAVIGDLMTGQYSNPITVVAFNLAERWAGDVSEDVAREIQRRADLANEDLISSIADFVERHAGRERQLGR